MIYGYSCQKCDIKFDVIKSAKEYDREERCESCGEIAQHHFVPNSKAIMKNSGLQDEAKFNIGLGKVIKGKAHQKEVCKQMGVEEIGTTSPETIHKHFDTRREEKLDKAYDDVFNKQWVGNGE